MALENYSIFLSGPVNVYLNEYLEQVAEINEEDPPEIEEDDEEESEIEAIERMKSAIIEHFEEQIESNSLLQVYLHSLEFVLRCVDAFF